MPNQPSEAPRPQFRFPRDGVLFARLKGYAGMTTIDEPHCESQGCGCSPSLPCDESECDGRQHWDGGMVRCTMCRNELAAIGHA